MTSWIEVALDYRGARVRRFYGFLSTEHGFSILKA